MISGLTEEMVNKVEQVTFIIMCIVSSLSGSQHYDIRIDRRNGELGGAGYYYNNVYVSSLSGSQHYDIRIDRRNGELGGAGYYYNNVYVSSLSGSQYYDIRIDRRNGE